MNADDDDDDDVMMLTRERAREARDLLVTGDVNDRGHVITGLVTRTAAGL